MTELLLVGGILGYFYALVTKFEILGGATARLWEALQAASEKVAAPKK